MILTPVDTFLNSRYLTSVVPGSRMLKMTTLSVLAVRKQWMKTVPDWFGTLHPFVQVVLVICSFALVIALIFNREAFTNFLNLLPWFLALLGGKKIHKVASLKARTKSKSRKSDEKE